MEELKTLERRPEMDSQGREVHSNIKENLEVEFEDSPFTMEDEVEIVGIEEEPKWVRHMKEPTNQPSRPADHDLEPEISIELEHCYGYRVKYLFCYYQGQKKQLEVHQNW